MIIYQPATTELTPEGFYKTACFSYDELATHYHPRKLNTQIFSLSTPFQPSPHRLVPLILGCRRHHRAAASGFCGGQEAKTRITLELTGMDCGVKTKSPLKKNMIFPHLPKRVFVRCIKRVFVRCIAISVEEAI